MAATSPQVVPPHGAAPRTTPLTERPERKLQKEQKRYSELSSAPPGECLRPLIPQMGHDRRCNRRIWAKDVLPACHTRACHADVLNACAVAHIAEPCPSGIDGPICHFRQKKSPTPMQRRASFSADGCTKAQRCKTAGPPRSKRRTEAKSRPLQALVKMLGRSIGMALAPCCWCRSVRKGLMEPESARA